MPANTLAVARFKESFRHEHLQNKIKTGASFYRILSGNLCCLFSVDAPACKQNIVKGYYTDLLFTLKGLPVQSGMVLVNDDDTIVEVLHPGQDGYDIQGAMYCPGWIVPGFINSHCHLELSHLEGKIPAHSGLDEFIEHLSSIRDAELASKQLAMKKADQAMSEVGTVFVGDISNGSSSFGIKADSSMTYHTFIERFGLHRSKAESAYESGKALLKELQSLRRNHAGNLSLHAPYSVSEELLSRVCTDLVQTGGLLSIHNQETASEQELFTHSGGKMAERLSRMGISDSAWLAPGISSFQWLQRIVPKEIRILFVHNTFTTAGDIQDCSHRDFWFCLCPGANLYIEDRLPDVNLFRKYGLNLVIGTDSLASNSQLNVFEELKTLSRYFPEIQAEELLIWACLNGAKLFGREDTLGSIAPGKKPGLVWISGADPEGKKILPECKARKL